LRVRRHRRLYNYFRDYDPAVGRYSQSDPIGLEGGINTFAYVENSPGANTDPTGEFLNSLLGGITGVAGGYLIAQLTGDECYDWKDAAVDFGAGAVGAGLISKLNKLNRIRKLRNAARERGMSDMGTKNTIETWKGSGFERLKIKHAPSNNAPHPGSRVPRAEFRVDAGRYLDPFSGQTGGAGSLSHLPLEPLIPAAAAGVGVASAAATPTCGCN
jgi:uncharacterized protein RhaS with RHS repeats